MINCILKHFYHQIHRNHNCSFVHSSPIITYIAMHMRKYYIGRYIVGGCRYPLKSKKNIR